MLTNWIYFTYGTYDDYAHKIVHHLSGLGLNTHGYPVSAETQYYLIDHYAWDDYRVRVVGLTKQEIVDILSPHVNIHMSNHGTLSVKPPKCILKQERRRP